MFQISVVVFREIFEIALIVGILAAATKEIGRSGRWIFGGIVSGVFASFALAFFTDQISESIDGMGQEIFNGAILFAAAAMISWTILWMQKNAKSLSGDLKNLGKKVQDGEKSLYAIFLVVFFSVLREGAEIVLFTYSYYISGSSIYDIVLGLISGVILGAGFGLSLYFGILKFFGRYFFVITSWMLIFFSAGMVAQGVGFWVSADLILPLGNPIFDLSNFIPQQSFFGKILNVFFGYIDRPYGSQLISYFSILGFLIITMKSSRSSSNRVS